MFETFEFNSEEDMREIRDPLLHINTKGVWTASRIFVTDMGSDSCIVVEPSI